jgi:hypothetical protein
MAELRMNMNLFRVMIVPSFRMTAGADKFIGEGGCVEAGGKVQDNLSEIDGYAKKDAV